MTTQEGNKLIAEFMGWKRMATKASDWLLSYEVEGMKYAVKQCSDTQLKFNTSWDWLMPVVEKIESLNKYAFSIDYQPKIGHWVAIHNVTEHGISRMATPEVIHDFKIIAVYQAVLQFIQWYNSQSKPTQP